MEVVYSRLALHHLPDFWKAVALRRVAAMLVPGGLFRLVDVVFDFEVDEAPARLEAWCATAGTETASEWTRAEYAEHLRDEHSTFTWLLEPMITRAGFEVVEAESDTDGIFTSYLLRTPTG